MIKKIVLMLAAALAMCPAYGQTPDTTSTVVGRKLNFEAPIFGLSKRDLKPSWSLVFLDDVSLGLHYLPGAPAEIKSAGIFAELFPLAFRYRPWRDGNVFSAGLLIGTTMNGLRKGYAFADNGSIVPMPTTWKKDWSYYTSLEIGLQIGYVKEFGDWKAGAFVIPAYAHTLIGNQYSLQEAPGINHIHNMQANHRFQLGFKAGIWYNDIGVSVGYRPAIWKRNGPVPLYPSLQVEISLRY